MRYSIRDDCSQITRPVKEHGFGLLPEVKLDVIDVVTFRYEHVEAEVDHVERDEERDQETEHLGGYRPSSDLAAFVFHF